MLQKAALKLSLPQFSTKRQELEIVGVLHDLLSNPVQRHGSVRVKFVSALP